MTCTKTKFSSQQFALDYIKIIKGKSNRSKIPTRAYLCRHCNAWHLTSKLDYKAMYENELIKTGELKKQIEELIKQIAQITSKQLKKEKQKLKGNPLVTQLQHQIQLLNQRIKKVKQDNQELIIENLKLKNK